MRELMLEKNIFQSYICLSQLQKRGMKKGWWLLRIWLQFCLLVLMTTTAMAAPRKPIEDECAELLSHFATLDSSIERPLAQIFSDHAFELVPVGAKDVSEARLNHFYDLIRHEVLTRTEPSNQLFSWIDTEHELSAAVQAGQISYSEPVRILKRTLQALVVTAVATDLVPIVDNPENEYKLVFVSLVFSQRAPPARWNVKLQSIQDQLSRNFLARAAGLTNYRLYHFLQKGPFSGRVEVLYGELANLRPRAAEEIRKYKIEEKLRPYMERTLGPYVETAEESLSQ